MIINYNIHFHRFVHSGVSFDACNMGKVGFSYEAPILK